MVCTGKWRRRSIGFATVLLATGCSVGALGQTISGGDDSGCGAYASIALPAEAESTTAPKEFPACASYRSYRGIGRPVNDDEARACAWRERLAQKAGLAQNPEEPTAWVVGGSLILADIYFNGAGVKRDVPLAVHLACESEDGMASLALRDITKLGGALPVHRPFEFCDYAATTFSENFCAGYSAEIANDRRRRYYQSLKASMSSQQRAAFEKLLAAEASFIEAHAREVDQGGSIRNIRTLGSQNILNNLFHAEIVHAEHKEWPALTEGDAGGADAVLRGVYEEKLRKLRTNTQDEIEGGAVTADNLAKVEAKWEVFRDAWLAFARLRYPAGASRIVAEVTVERYRYLKTI